MYIICPNCTTLNRPHDFDFYCGSCGNPIEYASQDRILNELKEYVSIRLTETSKKSYTLDDKHFDKKAAEFLNLLQRAKWHSDFQLASDVEGTGLCSACFRQNATTTKVCDNCGNVIVPELEGRLINELHEGFSNCSSRNPHEIAYTNTDRKFDEKLLKLINMLQSDRWKECFNL